VYYTVILSRNLVLRQESGASLELILFLTLFMLQKFAKLIFNALFEQKQVYTSGLIAAFLSDFLNVI